MSMSHMYVGMVQNKMVSSTNQHLHNIIITGEQMQ